MDSAGRWLVCSGAAAFLPIAGSLVAAGCSGGIEWEPVPTKAYMRAAQNRPFGVNAVVGAGVDEPAEVACTLAGMTDGATLLCLEGAGQSAAAVTARGVAAAVEPLDLARVLLERHAAAATGAPAKARVEPQRSYEEGYGAHFAATSGAGLGFAAAAAEDLEEPGSPPAEPDSPAVPVGHGLRHTGQFPRVGVEAQPKTARSQEEPAGCEAPPAGRPPVRLADVVAVEPTVCRPLVSLPQLECSVAGEDAHVPTICFASPQGGVGRTSLAVLAAVALAREGLSVALIDLDFQFGTCLGYLGADGTDGLFDPGVPPERVRVDARSLARCRTTVEAGLAAFEFCGAPEQAEVLSGMAARLVRAARAGADVAVVDLPAGVNETVVQVLELADRCLFVGDQRPLALESLAAQQELCARMGIARTKLVTVMNRCDPRHRDEGFLSRVMFEVQTPQVMRVFDGGADVSQLLSIGSAAELLTVRNRFALSTADLAHAVCADLGCLADPQPQAPRHRAPKAPEQNQPEKDGIFRRRRKEKREEEVLCPF